MRKAGSTRRGARFRFRLVAAITERRAPSTMAPRAGAAKRRALSRERSAPQARVLRFGQRHTTRALPNPVMSSSSCFTTPLSGGQCGGEVCD